MSSACVQHQSFYVVGFVTQCSYHTNSVVTHPSLSSIEHDCQCLLLALNMIRIISVLGCPSYNWQLPQATWAGEHVLVWLFCT